MKEWLDNPYKPKDEKKWEIKSHFFQYLMLMCTHVYISHLTKNKNDVIIVTRTRVRDTEKEVKGWGRTHT